MLGMKCKRGDGEEVMTVIADFSIESQKKFFVAMANDAKIRVTWDAACKTPYATVHGAIVLPPPNITNIEEWLYASHHEISHLFPENRWTYDVLPKLPNDSGVSKHVCNILCDHMVDKSRFGMYEGRDQIMDTGRALFLKEKIMPTFKMIDDRDNPWQALIAALFIWDTDTRGDWINSPHMLSLDSFTDEQRVHYKDYTDVFEEMLLEGKLLSCRKPKELCNLVAELLGLVKDMHEEKMEEMAGEGEGEGEPGEAGDDGGEEKSPETKDEGDEDAESEDDKLGKGSDRRDDTADKSAKDQHLGKKGAGVEMPDFLIDVYKPMDRAKEEHKATKHSYYHDGTAEDYVPFTRNQIVVVSEAGDMSDYRVKEIMNLCGKSTLSKKIRKHLLAIVAKRYQYGLKKGQLHYKNMHRVYSQPKPSMYKEKKSVQLQLDTAFEIVMDCSGSMSGTKYAYAAACSTSISEILNQLRIKHEIIGFTERGYLISYIFKAFNEIATTETLARRMGNRTEVSLMDNADGESVLFCAERLMHRKERNKIMIVLSDGYPAGSYHGDGHAYLREVAKRIEEKTSIYLIGLGMHTSAVEKFYKNNAVIDDISKLNDIMIDTLKENVMR